MSHAMNEPINEHFDRMTKSQPMNELENANTNSGWVINISNSILQSSPQWILHKWNPAHFSEMHLPLVMPVDQRVYSLVDLISMLDYYCSATQSPTVPFARFDGHKNGFNSYDWRCYAGTSLTGDLVYFNRVASLYWTRSVIGTTFSQYHKSKYIMSFLLLGRVIYNAQYRGGLEFVGYKNYSK